MEPAQAVLAGHVRHHDRDVGGLGRERAAIEDRVLHARFCAARPAVQLGDPPREVREEVGASMLAQRAAVLQVRPRPRVVDLALLRDLRIVLQLAAHVLPQRVRHVAVLAKGGDVRLQQQEEARRFRRDHRHGQRGERTQAKAEKIHRLPALALVDAHHVALLLEVGLDGVTVGVALLLGGGDAQVVVDHGRDAVSQAAQLRQRLCRPAR